MGALGGLVIGAACGIAAVASANVLGDQPERFIPYGVMICALVGAIGGLFGQYAAWIREFIAHAALDRSARPAGNRRTSRRSGTPGRYNRKFGNPSLHRLSWQGSVAMR